MDFEIDYGAFQAPTKAAPLYASVGGRVSSLSNEEVVFYDPLADQAHVMTQQVLQAMDLCRPFRSLDEHAAHVVQALPQLKGQQAAVRRVLDGLASRGLLQDGTGLLDAFAAAPAQQQAPFAGLFVRACERPRQLRRLLDSALDRERAHGGGHAVTVVDDSSDNDAGREHAALLREYGNAAGVAVRYVGQSQWQDLQATMQRALPEHAAAIARLLGRDASFGGRRGGGTGKNLVTLLSAGHRYALLDDDFQFPLHRHPEYQPGLAFDGSGWAPRTFATPEHALAAGIADAGAGERGASERGAGEPDWLADQLAICGASLGALVNRIPGMELGPDQLRQLVPSRMPHLRSDARVLATVNGHRGDAGSSGMAWLFALDAAGRAGFAASRSDYLAALERPGVWHGARRFQVSRGANFTPFLVDNGHLSPCTSPYGRSEDALFAAVSAAWHGDGVVVGTPYAIGHLQEGARGRSELMAHPETPDINLCIAEFVRSVGEDLQGTDPLRRNAVLVARLRDLAAGSHAALLSYLREYLAYLRSSIVQALQSNLAAATDAPLYWAADLRRLVEINGRALADGQPPRFAGWPAHADEAACVAAFRSELMVLADGLEAWPALWELARDKAGQWLGALR